jgi:jumonji domain-containing protein 2
MTIEIPTVKLTENEYQNFYQFITKNLKKYSKFGLLKVVPPVEIKPKMDFKVSSFYKQKFNKKGSCFKLHSNVKYNDFTIEELREFCEQEPTSSPTSNISTLTLDPNIIQQNYWSDLQDTTAIYAADLPGSLFDPLVENSWNISRLDNLLCCIPKIVGVNTSYLYFGASKSTFAFHLEDVDLYSINFLHFGQPKFWYVVPPFYRKKFEALACSLFPLEFKGCTDFLRHKNVLIPPHILEENGIPFNTVLQNPNEFIITFPNGFIFLISLSSRF